MGTRYEGDSRLRVSVNKPVTLHELQAHAHRHFGHHGKISLWHKGQDPVNAPQHIKSIKHNDVVVVTWGDQKPPEGFTPLTTHMADYVKHPLEQPLAAAAAAPREAAPKVPFVGRSSYTADFVKHPLASGYPPSRPDNNSALWLPTRAPTGPTTYSTHYVKHPHEKQQPRPRTASHTARPRAPFEGKSSYTHDFIKHPIEPVPRPSSNAALARPKAPFEGITTYAGDFQSKPIEPNHPARQPRRASSVPVPFQGQTEYNREYPEKHIEMELVHIEPDRRLTRH